jgi:hypothetical protein
VRTDRFAAGLPWASSWGAWTKLWEVGVTAPIVIGYRLAGMARTGSGSTARDRREVTRMGQEKVDAWSEATIAAGRRLFEANMAMAGLVWRVTWGGPFSPTAFTARLARLGSGLLTDSVAPVHRRVVANNRRLSRAR